jgi:hypothetical protein
MEVIEVKSLIWAQKGKLYIFYEKNEVEASHHLISIRLYFILTILITEDGSQPYFFLTIGTQLVFTVY